MKVYYTRRMPATYIGHSRGYLLGSVLQLIDT